MTHMFTGLTPLLQVYDMNEALTFWRDALGFEVAMSSAESDYPEGRYFHWCLLRNGAAEVMLNTAYDAGERPLARDAQRESAHGDAMFYLGSADIERAYVELRSKGFAVEPPAVTPHGTKQIAMRDPDGYPVLIVQLAAAPDATAIN